MKTRAAVLFLGPNHCFQFIPEIQPHPFSWTRKSLEVHLRTFQLHLSPESLANCCSDQRNKSLFCSFRWVLTSHRQSWLGLLQAYIAYPHLPLLTPLLGASLLILKHKKFQNLWCSILMVEPRSQQVLREANHCPPMESGAVGQTVLTFNHSYSFLENILPLDLSWDAK